MTEAADRAIEEFLTFYPPAIVRQTQTLRRLVRRAVPSAVERLRPGWRLIGYDLPTTKHLTYFAYIAPEEGHVHLGFEYGALMFDPDGVLNGAHLGLRRVRYLTYQPTEPIDARVAVNMTREAARVAALPPAERELLALQESS